jgi:hypothetical protein
MPILHRRIWVGLVSVIVLVTVTLVRATPPVTGDVVAQEGATLSASLSPLLPYQGGWSIPPPGSPSATASTA